MSKGRFVIHADASGSYGFRLLAANGQTIAHGEGYTSLAACKTGIDSVMKNAPSANYEDQTTEGCQRAVNPKFELYCENEGEFFFRLKARNGETIAVSESYKSKQNCENGIESVRRHAAEAEVAVET